MISQIRTKVVMKMPLKVTKSSKMRPKNQTPKLMKLLIKLKMMRRMIRQLMVMVMRYPRLFMERDL